MTTSNHQLARDFLAGVSRGELPESLVTPDMTAWTLTSGETDKGRFLGGVKVLSGIFAGTLVYDIDAITAEDDRVIAEARSRGTLVNGDEFHNHHVFIFRVRDGRVARVAEYMNPFIVQEKLVPLIQQAMERDAP